MSSVVYYKFKSAKDHDHVSFDGTAISVFDLKREILSSKKLGKGTDFDLAIYNPHNNEEYKDDNYMVPRSSSVIVRRLPASAPGKGSAQRYLVSSVAAPTGGTQDLDSKVKGRGTLVQGTAIGTAAKRYSNYSMRPPTKEADQLAATAILPLETLTENEDSEDARIQAMFNQSSEHWKHEQERMAGVAPVGLGNASGQRRRPAQQHSHLQDRPPPANYVCYRCGQKGHFIQFCPTNGDPAFDKPKIRRTTGIPRSFLRAVEAAPDKRETGLMITPDGGLVVAAPDARAWEQYASRQSRGGLVSADTDFIPEPSDPNLLCALCSRLIRDAVLTACCNKSCCDECIRETLILDAFICPFCQAPNQTPECLIPDQGLRDQVDVYVSSFITLGAPNNSPPANDDSPSSQAIAASLGQVGRRIVAVRDGRDPLEQSALNYRKKDTDMYGFPILPPPPPPTTTNTLPNTPNNISTALNDLDTLEKPIESLTLKNASLSPPASIPNLLDLPKGPASHREKRTIDSILDGGSNGSSEGVKKRIR